MERTAVKGRPYLRVSQDGSGRERSPDEQFAVIAADAENQGVTLETGYRDTTGASRFTKGGRNGFDKLIADLEADRFGADMLILWESSRGSRRVGEWLRLIELCEDRHVVIHVHLHHRTYDPANARDRRSLLEDAVDSEFEVAKTSERVRRAMAANAVAGRPSGGPSPFGFKRVHNERTGALVGQEIDEAEAAVVDEIYRRCESGHALNAICTDLTARGLLPRSGLPWTPVYMRHLLRNPAYDGLRDHKGERHDAAWPRLVPHRRWLAVQRILDDPSRKTRRPGRARHLLSLIALCDVCGAGLAVLYKRRTVGEERMYVCTKGGHVKIQADEVDLLVLAAVAAYLDVDEHFQAFEDRGDDAELEAVTTRLADARAEHDALAGLSARLAAKMEPPILAQIAALEAREDELRTPSQLSGLLPPGPDMVTRIESAPLAARRTVMRLVLAPGRLGECRVGRSTTPGKRSPVGLRLRFRE